VADSEVKFKFFFPHFVHCSAGIATCHSNFLNVTISVWAPPNPVCTQGVDSKVLGHCRENASSPCSFIYDPVRGKGFPSTCPREFFGFPIFLVGHEQFQWLKALDSTLRGKTRAIPYLSELDRILVLLWLSSKLVNSAPIPPWSKRTSLALREPSQCYFGQPAKLCSTTVLYTLRKDKQPTNSYSIYSQKIPFSAKYLAKTSRHSIIWRLW